MAGGAADCTFWLRYLGMQVKSRGDILYVGMATFSSVAASLPLCLSACLSVCVFVCLYLSVSLPLSVSVHIPLSPSCLTMSVHLFVSLSLLWSLAGNDCSQRSTSTIVEVQPQSNW